MLLLTPKLHSSKTKNCHRGCMIAPARLSGTLPPDWYKTYQKFMGGLCGKPHRKRKTDRGSIYLTNELFRFDVCEDGVTRLFIGTKTNNIGYLSFKSHQSFGEPNSLYIRKEAGRYFVSFCYDDGSEEPAADNDHLEYLKSASKEWLEDHVIGVDRGVAIPVHTVRLHRQPEGQRGKAGTLP